MSFIIDGHNLIPKAGLDLATVDDEMELVPRLQEFCRLRRTKVEVFFDGAPPGQPATRRFGAVTAHFVRKGATADAAIEAHLHEMGKAAKNWTVVSSDGRVQRAAGAAHAQVITSEEFSRQMQAAHNRQAGAPDDPAISPGEVQAWEDEFNQRGKS